MAVAALVIGIIGLLLCWAPLFGLVLPIVAIVLGARALSRSRGMAIAGLALGGAGALISLIVTVVVFATSGPEMDALRVAEEREQAEAATQLEASRQPGMPLFRWSGSSARSSSSRSKTMFRDPTYNLSVEGFKFFLRVSDSWDPVKPSATRRSASASSHTLYVFVTASASLSVDIPTWERFAGVAPEARLELLARRIQVPAGAVRETVTSDSLGPALRIHSAGHDGADVTEVLLLADDTHGYRLVTSMPAGDWPIYGEQARRAMLSFHPR